ncbi:hypothetical protein VCRA2122O12_40224 [Vibrio crassostreae]|nr:hypothetical protein VCRA2114E5_30242 [Vibrio crassostreae]CAK2088417.1 hypothetical protein VCRA2110O4_40222 [Vibrio crassostreae]CAK2093792.1 hypothetical protein VCRA2110O1_40226 [Vibrio crassostreae]CAK2872314.1 hypothetical protein VCRA2110O3_40221 [Vibrio crassostreae]CAK2969756.1 hypothetical protein VCRA2110O2_60239 [Vibrio crassostreae]
MNYHRNILHKLLINLTNYFKEAILYKYVNNMFDTQMPIV